MGKFLVDLVIYTFAVFGIIYYFNYLINSLKRKLYSAKIVLIVDGYDKMDVIINDVKNNIINNKIADDAYIVLGDVVAKLELIQDDSIKLIDKNSLIQMLG